MKGTSDYYSANETAGDVSLLANSTSATSSTTRWLTEEVFKLIDMVQGDEAIYNPRHKYYFCRPYVENFWREVDLKLEKNLGASLAKWTNLRISFRREYTNYLEEKVPPCWSYFDRMFFLHPYLRKKHQQLKSLDSHVQDALVQMNNYSNRCQRDRAAGGSMAVNIAGVRGFAQQQTQQPPDNILDFFEAPEAHSSESEYITDEEQHLHYPKDKSQLLNNEIKSECEDAPEDGDYDPVPRDGDESEEQEANDTAIRNYVMNSLANTSNAALQDKRAPYFSQYMTRIPTRACLEDSRAKRSRSNDDISTSQVQNTQRVAPSNMPSQSSSHSISYARTCCTKPTEIVSTTTVSNHAVDVVNIADIMSSSAGGEAAINIVQQHSTGTQHQQRHTPHLHHHHHRLEMPSIGSSVGAGVGVAAAAKPSSSLGPTGHLELCDCKTDPDAMFLMSLLPDIQQLNGRDRGKIKIAFQNILQDYLYPD